MFFIVKLCKYISKINSLNYDILNIFAAVVEVKTTLNVPIAFATETVKAAPPVIAGVFTVILPSNTKVTVFAPAELSIMKSNDVPILAPSADAKAVAVGVVIDVAAAEVDVIYPDKIWSTVAVAVASIATGKVVLP